MEVNVTTRGLELARKLRKDIERYRYLLVLSLQIIAIVVLVTLCVLNLIQGKIWGGMIELSMVLVFLGLLIYLVKTKNRILPTTISIIFLIVFIDIYVIITGGLSGTGIYWVSIIPVISFLALDVRMGLYWTLAYLIIYILIFLSSLLGLFSTYYSETELIIGLVVMIAISIIAYIGQFVAAKKLEVVNMQSKKLIEESKELEKSYDLVKKAETEARDQAEKYEKTNKFMVGRELKMIELKKEIQRLKSNHQQLNDGEAISSKSQLEKDRSESFQEAVDTEDRVIESLESDYHAVIDESKLSKAKKEQAKVLLNHLIIESKEHKKMFLALKKVEDGQSK